MSTADIDFPLTRGQQLRNVWLYAFNIAMTYFAAPVMYVGLLQSALCKYLNQDDNVANLPGSAYLWATPIPVLIIWCYPQVRSLKLMMVVAYAAEAVISAIFLAALYSGRTRLIVSLLVIHAVVLGIANGLANTCLWEVLGRGVANSRRGLAFTLAFGFGPFFAVIGSLGSQLILGKKDSLNFGSYTSYIQPFLDWLNSLLGGFQYPLNYAIIFGACIPAMLLCSIASAMIVIPMSESERAEPIRIKFDKSNLGLREFFGNRLIQLGAVAYILIYSAEQIGPNMNSYIQVLTGREPEEFAGLNNALRFGFKIIAGFVLGWMTLRSGPKATLYLTSFLCMFGLLWAINVRSEAYLFAFGWMGAGELFGNYFPNYIACCSNPNQVRRNMCYTNMVSAVAGFAGQIYGSVSNRWGYPASFYVALGFVFATLAVVQFLPRHPRPAESIASN